MQASTTALTCAKGHPQIPENLLHRSDRTATRCRLCHNEGKKGQRQRAADLRREARARMRANEPERWEELQRLAHQKRVERERQLPLERQIALIDRRRENMARSKKAREIAKTWNVTVPEYNALLEESTLSEDALARDQNRPSAAWNLLKVKGDALPVWDEFSLHLETTVTPCQGSNRWTEFDDPRAGREDEATGNPAPTRSLAKEMCNNCPLIDLCLKFAQKDKPDFGVWGGKVWLGGKAQ